MVDGGGLENHCTRKGTGGSNPSLSANLRSCSPAKMARRNREAAKVGCHELRLAAHGSITLAWCPFKVTLAD